MKYLSLLIACALLLTACKKDEEETPNTPVLSYVTMPTGLDVDNILHTPDGGFILWSAHSNAIQLIKISASGVLEWNKLTALGTGSVYNLIQAPSGDFYAVGSVYNGTDNDVALTKLDQNGEKIWSKLFDSGVTEQGRYITNTNDGYIAIAGVVKQQGGSQADDLFVLKTDLEGNQLSLFTIDKPQTDEWITGLIQLDDGRFVLSFDDNSNNTTKVLQADALGNIQWENTISSANSEVEVYTFKKCTNGFVMCGDYLSNEANDEYDGYVAKFDANGIKQWEAGIGAATNDDAFLDVIETASGNFLAVGGALSLQTDQADATMAVISPNGQNKQLYYFGIKAEAYAYSIAKTQQGSYKIVGFKVTDNQDGYQVFTTLADANGKFIQ